jgi:hypothetical protein
MTTFNSWSDITWPSNTACTTLNLGAIPADQNCLLVPPLSQVSDLYIQPDGASAPFDWTDPAAPAAPAMSGIDNTATDNSATKWLVGKGGVEAPEESLYTGPKLKKKVVRRLYTLQFEVEVTNDDQRDFLRQLQSGWSEFTFWIGTLGNNLFGDSTGIIPSFVNAQLPLDPGDEDYEKGTIIIEYYSEKGDPPRYTNPLANS